MGMPLPFALYSPTMSFVCNRALPRSIWIRPLPEPRGKPSSSLGGPSKFVRSECTTIAGEATRRAVLGSRYCLVRDLVLRLSVPEQQEPAVHELSQKLQVNGQQISIDASAFSSNAKQVSVLFSSATLRQLSGRSTATVLRFPAMLTPAAKQRQPSPIPHSDPPNWPPSPCWNRHTRSGIGGRIGTGKGG